MEKWQIPHSGPADGVACLQVAIATPSDPQPRHFRCSYLRPFQTSTESLRSLPMAVVWCLAFHPASLLFCLHMVCRLGCWETGIGHMGQATNHELLLPPAMSDMVQSYCNNTCIYKRCLLVGRDNRSKQALPARSPFVTPLHTID